MVISCSADAKDVDGADVFGDTVDLSDGVLVGYKDGESLGKVDGGIEGNDDGF